MRISIQTPGAVDSLLRERVRRGAAVLEDGVTERWFPGAIFGLGRPGEWTVTGAVGRPSPTSRRPARAGDLYDMASVTKPTVTATTAMRLIDGGSAAPGMPVSEALDQPVPGRWRKVRLEHLLTHTSGVAPHAPLFRTCGNRDEFVDAILSMEIDPPGRRYAYSCLGYILLGIALERLGGATLDTLARREVWEPLGMPRAEYRALRTGDRPGRAESRALGTGDRPGHAEYRALRTGDRPGHAEYRALGTGERPGGAESRPSGTGERAGRADRNRVAPTERCEWRGCRVRGEVHDENAHAIGGVSGNAGLFASALDLHRYAEGILCNRDRRGQPFLSARTWRALTRNRLGGIGGHATLGWPMGRYGVLEGLRTWSTATLSHTGFTGTSLLLDPRRGGYCFLLTNRVYYGRDRFDGFARVRKRFWAEAGAIAGAGNGN